MKAANQVKIFTALEVTRRASKDAAYFYDQRFKFFKK